MATRCKIVKNPYIAKHNKRNIQHNNNDPFITPILKLKTLDTNFTIKGRITKKGNIGRWFNKNGSGRVTSLTILDVANTDMSITMFSETINKWYSFLELGQIYTITNGSLREANPKYNECISNLQLIIQNNTTISKCLDSNNIPIQRFQFVKINRLENENDGSYVDVIGIVQEFDNVESVTSKYGKTFQKCNLNLIDDTGTSIRLTLWNDSASNTNAQLKLQNNNNTVVAVKHSKVTDFCGKTLSGAINTFINPKISQTTNLQRWWLSQGPRKAPFISLSHTTNKNVDINNFFHRGNINDIMQYKQNTNNNKTFDVIFKGYFSKITPAWFTACPNKKRPCFQLCKVKQTLDQSYYCGKCNRTYNSCIHKWLFSNIIRDNTSSTRVTIFDKQAQQLFNRTAEITFARGDEKTHAKFQNANNTEWIFKCRVKQKEQYAKGKYYFQTHIVEMKPVDYKYESIMIGTTMGLNEKQIIIIQTIIRGYLQRLKYNTIK